MKSYNFHINLYDLAFLGTIFIGLTFAVLLLFTKSINQPAKRFLGLALVVMVLWMLSVSGMDIRIGNYPFQAGRLPLQFSLALGPLIYFYVLKLTRPDRKSGWKDSLHFIPALMQQLVWMFTAKEQLTFLSQSLTFISFIIYLYWSHRLIEDFYQRLKFNGGDRYRNELQWLHRLLVGFGLLCLLWIPFAAANYFTYHNLLRCTCVYPLYLVLAATITWIGAVAFLRPEIELPGEASPVLKPSAPVESRQKGAWLKKAMEANLYHQDPELSLSSLAEKLDIHPHELSRIINIALKKNFNDFINEYRVKDVARKMQDPAYDHITLLGIAFESGFNSQSTFTRAFKQITGKTPLEYKNDLKKDWSSYNLGSRPQFASLILHRETATRWSQGKLNRNYMFKNYLKIAWRNISRNKAYTAINVLGLSLGICACLIIYLITSFELSYDTFHPDKDRIYRIVTLMQDAQGNSNDGASGVIPLPIAAREPSSVVLKR